ncbi:biotin-dependent carboxyltransferase family protein [Marinicella sp. W31]|uniref:5-oxoprolinase subunit C family protein n=1 Tax=Marinicella sp. W31 TaxID=3023713 RepID=UPI003757A455
MSLTVVKAGLMTSLQDLGRSGYAHLGVPGGGAMDKAAAKLANHLVGNPADTAVLEITASGPVILLQAACSLAITGAEFSVTLDDQLMDTDCTLHVMQGQRLAFGALKAGFRAYLACAGGFDVPSILGSASMLSGGLVPDVSGRLLQAGDVLTLNDPKIVADRYKYVWQKQKPQKRYFVHAMPGPEADYFSSNELRRFFSHSWEISQDANRMGYRLLGESIATRTTSSMLSIGLMPGSVQVTPSGQALLCLRDAQTTGGYPRIAVVNQADLDVLAQARPGDHVWFSTHARS